MKILLTTLVLSLALVGNVEAGRKKTVKPKAQPVKHIIRTYVPEFSAKSYLIADSTGTVLREHDMNTVMPIASITKLMIGILAAEQNLDEHLPIPTSREVQSRIPYRITTLTRRELLTLALVKSDNLAAQVLCDNLPNCIGAMNAKATSLGMSNTRFDEPTGLSSENVSTANDLLKLMLAASRNRTVSYISSMKEAEIETDKNPIRIKNTNPLTFTMDVILSKTGYTIPAGGCLVMTINSVVGPRILILLGSKNARTRVPDMERLVKGLDNN